MKPLTQNKISFKNKCGCIVDYEILESAMLWMSRDHLHSNRTIYLHGLYPCVTIYNKKIHVHRLIASFCQKRILGNSEYVHHKNGDKLDSSICNLEVLNDSVHQSLHNKGKTLSDEHKKKISFANTLRKGSKRKLKVTIDLDLLSKMLLDHTPISRIAKHFKCDWSTIKKRIHDNPDLL